jgi:hypothetical protein
VRTASGGGSGQSASFFFDALGTPGDGFRVNVSASPVPEPSSLVLVATGLAEAAWGYRKKSGIGTAQRAWRPPT